MKSAKVKHLANGLKVCFIPVEGAKSAEVRLLFNAGFQYFDTQTYHLPHLLEHLLLSMGGVPGGEDKLLNELQLFGANTNASTENEYVTVYLSGSAKNIAEAYGSLHASVFGLALTEEIFVKEKQVVLRELHEKYDGLLPRITDYLLHKSYPDLLPETWSVQFDYVDAITMDQVMQAYKSFIRPDNATLVIAGPSTIDVEQILRTASSAVAQDDQPLKQSTQKYIDHPSTIEPVALDTGRNSSLLLLFAPDIAKDRPSAERAAGNLAMLMLFDLPSARLPKYLRDQGYVYDLVSEPVIFKDRIMALLQVFVETDRAHNAGIDMMSILYKYALGDVTKDEVESAKRFIISNLENSEDTPADMIEWYLPDILNDRPLTSIEDEVALIEKLTVADVVEQIQTYLVKAPYSGAIIARDAASWAEHFTKAVDQLRAAETTDAVDSILAEQVKIIQNERDNAPEFIGYFWVVYYFAAFASMMACIVVPFLKPTGYSHYVSASGLSGHLLVWIGAVVGFFALAGSLGYVKGKRSKLAGRFMIAAQGIAASIYLYGFFAYLGGFHSLQTAHPQSLFGLLPLAYSLLLAPFAVVGLVLRLISLKMEK